MASGGVVPGADGTPAAEALKKMAQLSVLPGTFTAAAIATVLGWEEELDPSSPTGLKTIQDLKAAAPGCLEEVGEGVYRLAGQAVEHLRRQLAHSPAAEQQARLRMVSHVVSRCWVRPGDDGAALQEAVGHVLQLVAEGKLTPEAINSWHDEERGHEQLGLKLCRCMDAMCVSLKCHPCAEAALKLLLQCPHDPLCPFCVIHLYPTLHAQGKLREMEELLQLIPARGFGPDNPLYHSVDVHLDFLTCMAYSLLLQGRAEEAEAFTRRALEACRLPWQVLNNTNNLLFALRRQGRLEEARAAAAQVQAMIEQEETGGGERPDDERRFHSESLLAVGLVQRDLGQLEEAEETLLRAVEDARQMDDANDVDDMRIVTCYHAAKVLLRRGDKVKAAQAVVLAAEARQLAGRCCMEGHTLPLKLQVLLVDAIHALYRLAPGPPTADSPSPTPFPTPPTAAVQAHPDTPMAEAPTG